VRRILKLSYVTENFLTHGLPRVKRFVFQVGVLDAIWWSELMELTQLLTSSPYQQPTNISLFNHKIKYSLTFSMTRLISSMLLLVAFLGRASAFAPSPFLKIKEASRITGEPIRDFRPTSLQRQRKSVAQVQTMGLFGLGAPEIGIILVAAAFLLGPEKLASLGKDAGKIAGELKEVPKEFQAGMAEGEAQAKALKAKAEKQNEQEMTESSE
jgi:sec-independent protein translocase protein TatA